MNIISIYTERSHKFHFKVISLASTITLFMSWPLKNSHLIVIQQSLCDKMLKWEDFQHGKTLFRSHIIVTYLFTYVSNIPLKMYVLWKCAFFCRTSLRGLILFLSYFHRNLYSGSDVTRLRFMVSKISALDPYIITVAAVAKMGKFF